MLHILWLSEISKICRQNTVLRTGHRRAESETFHLQKNYYTKYWHECPTLAQ